MSAQIIYATMTGHSKKISNKISEITGINAANIKENPQVPACDVLFIVSGIYSGQVKPELMDYIKKLSPLTIKKVVLMTSSMTNVESGLRKVLIDAGFIVAEEEYLCQGGFLFVGLSHPNKDEILGAVEFVKKHISV